MGISRHLMDTNRHINGVNSGLLTMENRLASIKRLGLVGMGMAVTGVGMLSSLKGPVEQAMEWEREGAKLRQMGLGDAQIRDAQKFVQATDIIGTSMQQRMKLFVEAQGAFRESGMSGSHALDAARVMTPVLAGYEVAVKTLNGEKRTSAEHSMISLNRLVEQMGGLNDSKRAASIVDMAFRSVQASGKMITPDQLRQFRAYGGASVANYSDLAIFAGLEPIMGELKGSTTGTGLRTAFNRLQGLIKPPNQLLSEAERLGIWDSSKYTKNSMGGIKTMNGNPLNAELVDLMNTNPIAFAKRMMDIYEAHGISAAQRSRENTLLFGSNGAKVYDLIMRQMPTLERSFEAFNKSKGIDETNKSEANSPMMAVEKFHAAMSDLGLVVGQTVLPVLTPMITKMSGFFKGLQEYPRLLDTLTTGFVGLAGAMAIGGALNLATAGFKAVGLALSFGGVAGGLGGGISGVAAAIGTGGAGTLVGGILALGAAVGGLMWFFNKIGGDNHDEKNHPGMKFVRHGRGAGNGEWVVDPTQPQEHAGEHFVGNNRNGHWEKWNTAPFGVSAPKMFSNESRLSGSPYVAKARQPINVTVTSVLDGRKIAESTAKIFGKEASRPLSGYTGFDGSMSVPPVATGYQR